MTYRSMGRRKKETMDTKVLDSLVNLRHDDMCTCRMMANYDLQYCDCGTRIALEQLASLKAENANLQEHGDEWQRACQEQMRQNEILADELESAQSNLRAADEKITAMRKVIEVAKLIILIGETSRWEIGMGKRGRYWMDCPVP
jgi:hypothetical protein